MMILMGQRCSRSLMGSWSLPLFESVKMQSPVHFRLIQMPCCGQMLCWVNPRLPNYCPEFTVVSRIFRTFGLAERHPALAHAVMAPLICWSFSNSMFRYLFVDHAVPAMWRSLAAARLSAD